ncbi:MAG: hypothetical protein VKL39_09310 [Leptolyngbyaceae bacterium]|nr:hypothetical protein [Leptolyngbyaceae bacterium]
MMYSSERWMTDGDRPIFGVADLRHLQAAVFSIHLQIWQRPIF